MHYENGVQRVAIVTGAAGGIGSAIVEALMASNHAVVAVDADEEGLARLTNQADRLHTVVTDLSLAKNCEQAVHSAVTRFGRVEAVVNNVGIGISSIRPDAEVNPPTIEELTGEVWDRFFNINVRAAMLTTRAALPFMKQAAWGRIVNNTTSFLTMLRILPYGASKAAMEAMTAIWAKELGGTGITVNVVIPGGPTDTDFIADEAGIPRHQMLRPSIMGPPIAWLLSDDSFGFNGKRIIAAQWDDQLAPAAAARLASRDIAWPELTSDVIWPQDDNT